MYEKCYFELVCLNIKKKTISQDIFFSNYLTFTQLLVTLLPRAKLKSELHVQSYYDVETDAKQLNANLPPLWRVPYIKLLRLHLTALRSSRGNSNFFLCRLKFVAFPFTFRLDSELSAANCQTKSLQFFEFRFFWADWAASSLFT